MLIGYSDPEGGKGAEMSDFTGAVWRKSVKTQNSRACVEVARVGEVIGVRDSKDPDGPILKFTIREFEAFPGWSGQGRVRRSGGMRPWARGPHGVRRLHRRACPSQGAYRPSACTTIPEKPINPDAGGSFPQRSARFGVVLTDDIAPVRPVASFLKEWGRVKPRTWWKFVDLGFLGSVKADAEEGVGSRLSHRMGSTHMGGFGLEAGSELIFVPEVPGVCDGGVLQCPKWTISGAGSPVAGHSFATGKGRHGVLRPQPAGVNQVRSTAPPWVGIRRFTTSRAGCAGLGFTRVGPGNGRARRVARSRPA